MMKLLNLLRLDVFFAKIREDWANLDKNLSKTIGTPIERLSIEDGFAIYDGGRFLIQDAEVIGKTSFFKFYKYGGRIFSEDRNRRFTNVSKLFYDIHMGIFGRK